ncbi:branched-chain amino acid ABC transporter permease (plasmid) [Paroceanicella profunda]|uniref:Branched-chain amino acid ABC transporter permease n=1 Tax=Paroceanicella profunda TaxID=2579971 RepID=A0A5B8G2Y7_9RHOB|nr:branched-chain amino acid ABC transporter permease [Paroceanicella profunda]QDL94300.1 branched-chain amino acid ABC transporter permease [Paroceanicella profunda]
MIPQILLEGALTGALIGLGAIGLTLTYSILRFANFAHGELLTWGAYLSLSVAGLIGAATGAHLPPLDPFSFTWALPVAGLIAMLLTAALALAVDAVLFGRLRGRGASTIIVVMASFGASMALRSGLEFLYTSKPAYYTTELQIAMRLPAGMRATPDQLLMLGLTALVVLAVHLMLTRTGIGRAMRAVSENPALAGLVGIDTRKVIRVVWILGGALACAAGTMSGLLVQIRPYMGFDLLLPLFAAAILGGIGSVPGAMLGGLIVGICEAFAVHLIGAEWRAAVGFVLIILVLLARPSGLFGRAA